MELEAASPFSADRGKPLRQTHGVGVGEDRLYALVRPRQAEVTDGEAVLLIRDDAVGSGWWHLPIPDEVPADLITGADLPFDALAAVVTWNGYVVFVLPQGGTKVEKIPTVGDEFETDEEGAYGIVGGATLSSACIFVACSEGRVFVRTTTGDWQHANPSASVPFDAPRSEAIQLDAVAARDGQVVAVGRRDMNGTIVETTQGSGWARHNLNAQGLRSVAFDAWGVAWACGRGGVIVSRADGEWQMVHSSAPDITYTSLTSWQGRLFVSQALGGVLEFVEGGNVESIAPIPGSLTSPTISATTDGLLAQGENGFAMYDGEHWERIEVPW